MNSIFRTIFAYASRWRPTRI